MVKIEEKVEEKIEESKENIEKRRIKSRYIKLPNDWYDNKDITNEELTVLILLYRNYMQYKSIGVFGLDFLLKVCILILIRIKILLELSKIQ